VDLVEGQPTKWKVENSWGDFNEIGGTSFLPQPFSPPHDFAITKQKVVNVCLSSICLPSFLPLPTDDLVRILSHDRRIF
jgi:hypothetical protein